jgi:hypothetical protein
MTEPGQACPVCGLPDPEHDWDEHERQAEGIRYGQPAMRGAELVTAPLSMLARSSSRGGARVRWLAVHSTEGIMRAADLRDWQSWPGSSHASADQFGNLLEPDDGFVPYDRAAWTLRNGNPVSDNIELCAFAGWSRAEWLARPDLLELCAVWLARRHRARPWIPLVKLTVAQVRAGVAGVIDHDDYTDASGDGTHWDVGEAFPWDIVIPRARVLAGIDTDKGEGFLMALSDKEQGEALDILRDLRYGLRRPVIGGLTLSSAVRELLGRARGEIGGEAQPVTAGAELDDLESASAAWSDDEVRQLGETLAAELTAEQVRELLDTIARAS